MSTPAWMLEQQDPQGSSPSAPAFMPTSYSAPQHSDDTGMHKGNPMPMQGSSGGGDFDAPNDPTVYRFGDPADDLPLLEELGIYPSHIKAKALAVLHPLKPMNSEVVEDTDLAGPMVFALLMGLMLSLQGKLQFGAIYTVCMLGIVLAKFLLTMMAEQSVKLQFVISTLGYCLLPNILLAFVQTFKYWIWGSGGVMVPIALGVIAWSGWCATQMFVSALLMQEQRYLLLYPCLLFYATFAALTIF